MVLKNDAPWPLLAELELAGWGALLNGFWELAHSLLYTDHQQGVKPEQRNLKERRLVMLNMKVWVWSLGVWATISFVLCVLWGLITPEALHMHGLLEIVLPGFTWLSPAGFVLGLVESFAWGAYTALLFVPLHNFFWRRWQKE